jgi:minor histocompatibility antigen H13
MFTNSCLYIGSTRSLKSYNLVPKSQARVSSSATIWQIVQVPLCSTLALLTIYFSLKNEWDYVKNVIMGYFLLISVQVLYEHMYEFCINTFDWISYHDGAPLLFGLTRLKLFIYGIAIYSVYVYVKINFWIINNYIALSFCIYSIEKCQQTAFWQVVIIFILLIAYDVTFVFKTDVMMTVAKGFEAPMKILFPVKGFGYGMLGIGDIIVPGFLTSMCLRADFISNMIQKSKAQQKQIEEAKN